MIRGAHRPKTDFFLRAESLFTAATYLDELAASERLAGRAPAALQSYGGRSLHEQSHGESFLAVSIRELVGQGSQFIIATHSPLILAYPESTIYACTALFAD